MSVDTVNAALTRVRLSIQRHPDSFSPEGHRALLLSCEVMRHHLMREDIQGFDHYVDNLLAQHPDRADFILEELFQDLKIQRREELTAILEEV